MVELTVTCRSAEMNIHVSYSSKSYGLMIGHGSYTLEYSRLSYGSGVSIGIAARKHKYGFYGDGASRARIDFQSDQEALNFANSIISMIHLNQKELKFEVKMNDFHLL